MHILKEIRFLVLLALLGGVLSGIFPEKSCLNTHSCDAFLDNIEQQSDEDFEVLKFQPLCIKIRNTISGYVFSKKIDHEVNYLSNIGLGFESLLADCAGARWFAILDFFQRYLFYCQLVYYE